MTIYVIIQYILMFGAVIFIGYPFVRGLLALFYRRKKMVPTAFNHSFLIVIHSHNNEREISKTLYSLAGLIYPWNLYDMVVITDTCSDSMASISKKLGARIIECAPLNRGNDNASDPLQRALEQVEHLNEKYDAIVFIRPNDLISGNFLEVMNQYLAEGSVVIQSANRKISDMTTPKIKYHRVCWLLRTFIDALGRKKMGLGTPLLGSGMCFRTEVLKKNPIKLVGDLENFEYITVLQANQLQVHFAPEAVTWSPVSDTRAGAAFDRSHWTSRQFRRAKKQLKYVTSHYREGKLFQQFDLLIWIFTPPLLLMLAVAAGSGAVNIVLWKLGYIAARFWEIWMILTGMIIFYLSIGIVADRDGSPELHSKGGNKRKMVAGDKLLSKR